jgi:hypothetical protein
VKKTDHVKLGGWKKLKHGKKVERKKGEGRSKKGEVKWKEQ